MKIFNITNERNWFILLVIIGFIIYFIGLNIQYYGDDFQFVHSSPSSKIFHHFVSAHPINVYYRPIQNSYLALVQSIAGLNTIPVHLMQLFLHILLCSLVYKVVILLGFSRFQAAFGSLFMLVSQANVHAVLSNDTLSQVGGTLFGCLSLWFLYNFVEKGNKIEQKKSIFIQKYFILSILIFFISLLFKETSIPFLLLILFVILLINRESNEKGKRVRKISLEFLPYFCIIIFYLVVRSLVVKSQLTYGTGYYDFYIGKNIIKNITLFIFQSFLPFSSAAVFTLIKSSSLINLLLIVAATFIVFFLTIYGMWHSGKKGILVIVGVFAVICLFPAAFMNHISELYLYNSMPFISILIGVGFGCFFEKAKKNKISNRFLIVIIYAVFISHIISVNSKALLMKKNGRQATELITQIKEFSGKIPANGTLLLINSDENTLRYSVFILNEFNVLLTGTHILNKVTNRNDFNVKIIYENEMTKFQFDEAILALKIKENKVSNYD